MSQKAQGLNREFSEKDIQRMRNLVQGKYGEKNECDKRYRYPYVKKNPKNMDRYFIDYKKLTKHLYVRS